MAKAKRARRNSIRTMPADRALEALESLERAEPREQEAVADREEDPGRPTEPEAEPSR